MSRFRSINSYIEPMTRTAPSTRGVGKCTQQHSPTPLQGEARSPLISRSAAPPPVQARSRGRQGLRSRLRANRKKFNEHGLPTTKPDDLLPSPPHTAALQPIVKGAHGTHAPILKRVPHCRLPTHYFESHHTYIPSSSSLDIAMADSCDVLRPPSDVSHRHARRAVG